MKPKICAIICTYNRPAELRRSIQSLVEQSLPKTIYEVIVVDNSPNKSAYDIVEEFRDVGNVRYIHEPTTGLSRARNTGFKNARGEYIAYLDDDATADKDWLANICAAFAKSEAACVGGKVELVLESERPTWLADELLFCLGKLSCSDDSMILNGTGNFLHGCNMAFRKEVLIKFGGFNTRLGRTGRNLISSEETFLQKKIQDKGGICLYHPNIIVHHHIENVRLTKKWFERRMFSEGVSRARMRIYDEHMSMKKRLSTAAYELLYILKSDDQFTFARTCRIRRDLGYIVGLLFA